MSTLSKQELLGRVKNEMDKTNDWIRGFEWYSPLSKKWVAPKSEKSFWHALALGYEFRIADQPTTVVVCGEEMLFYEPMNKRPDIGSVAFYPDPLGLTGYEKIVWQGYPRQEYAYFKGFLHSTSAAAQAHFRILCKYNETLLA